MSTEEREYFVNVYCAYTNPFGRLTVNGYVEDDRFGDDFSLPWDAVAEITNDGRLALDGYQDEGGPQWRVVLPVDVIVTVEIEKY